MVNNASISGYASFPAASTYAASKAGVVALSESLRRELKGTGVRVLHVVTPGVNTDMLDATEEVYGRHMDTSGWDKVEPAEWVEKVLEAVEADRHILGPGGQDRLRRSSPRAARLPARRDQRPDVQPAAADLAGGAATASMSTPGQRLGQHGLHEPDPALGEAGLAVAQVHPPEAAEALVVAEALELARSPPRSSSASAAASRRSAGVRSWRWTVRRSVRLATHFEITSSEGRQPPGKT